MPEKIPPPFGLALTILRSARGWSQKRLAAESGVAKTMISDFEVGRRTLSRSRLDSLAAVLGYGSEGVDAALLCLERVRPAEDDVALPSSLGLAPAERRLVDETAALVAKTARDVTRSKLTRELQAARARNARQEVEALWERLRRHPPRDRRVLVESAVEFQTWALCERLCAESEKAAAADANRALELADLALRVAVLVPGEAGWRCRVQSYAWAHVGNARRVSGNLPGADEAFARFRKLWEAGDQCDGGLLADWRVYDMEASLRREQRRFPEALELLNRALATAGRGDSALILLNKANLQADSEDHSGAVQTLQNALPLIDGQRQPRLLCILQFNLAVSLCHLGRYIEAAELPPKVRSLAVQLGNGLDLARVLWLEGRIAAGLRRTDEAVSALEQVRKDFAALGIAYDAALASLDVAVLHLELGRAAEVKTLAREMAPIFQAQGVHLEALAALKLFCDAAEQEIATAQWTRRLIIFLERARNNPDLRFEE
ncbi:MAG: helix-turn-helix transcriptional regulator [Acidobacteria bacterium]|nr:helix-turn-helix transcriptional regulator [Acidobacteriota bacterium]